LEQGKQTPRKTAQMLVAERENANLKRRGARGHGEIMKSYQRRGYQKGEGGQGSARSSQGVRLKKKEGILEKKARRKAYTGMKVSKGLQWPKKEKRAGGLCDDRQSESGKARFGKGKKV